MNTTALSPVAKTDALPWQGKELEIIKNLIAPGLSDLELHVFGKVCQQTRLNPILKQIYAIKRSGKMTIQTSIDGYRLIAARTQQLAGTDKALYYYDDKGALIEAEITVYRMIGGQRCPFTASAFMAEYRPGAGQDHMWQKMPHRMLAKCAEALALRMAFPAELSGLYTHEEMEQAGAPDTYVDSEPATDPERERLINGIKRLWKENDLPEPTEDLYAVSIERLWEIGRTLKALAAEKAAQQTPVEAAPAAEAPKPAPQKITKDTRVGTPPERPLLGRLKRAETLGLVGEHRMKAFIEWSGTPWTDLNQKPSEEDLRAIDLGLDEVAERGKAQKAS